MLNIVKPDLGVTMLNNIFDNYEKCGHENIVTTLQQVAHVLLQLSIRHTLKPFTKNSAK